MVIQTNREADLKGDAMETELIVGNVKYKYDPVKCSITRFNEKYKMWVTVNFNNAETSDDASEVLIKMLTDEHMRKYG